MEDFISVSEASKISRLSPHYIRKLYNIWKIEWTIIEWHYFIKRSNLFEFIRKRRPNIESLHLQGINNNIINTSRQLTIDNQIIELEKMFNWDILIYMSQFWSNNSIILPVDWMKFDDILNWMQARYPWDEKKFKKIILYLSSPWGVLEASVKIIDIIKQYAESFEVIVPYMAKSAASLICLSADMIHMTTISELGPIDPIIENPTKPWQMIPARAIDEFIKYYSSIADSQWSFSKILLKTFEDKIDPYLLWSWKSALFYSQNEIQSVLKWKINNEKIEEIVNIFTVDEISHSHPITFQILNNLWLKNINQIKWDKLDLVKLSFTSFNDYMITNNFVKIIWNRNQCFNVQEIVQKEKA